MKTLVNFLVPVGMFLITLPVMATDVLMPVDCSVGAANSSGTSKSGIVLQKKRARVIRGSNPCEYTSDLKCSIILGSEKSISTKKQNRLLSIKLLSCTEARTLPNPTGNINSGWDAVFTYEVTTDR